jgi:hypothetical protein
LQPDDSSVRKGNVHTHGDIVNQKFGGKIIAAVNDKIITGKDSGGVVFFKPNGIDDDFHVRVELADFILG